MKKPPGSGGSVWCGVLNSHTTEKFYFCPDTRASELLKGYKNRHSVCRDTCSSRTSIRKPPQREDLPF